ncbi:MAG: ABC transporter ATP-binding protein [Acholeplasmatales bacterium]|nr:ABC transporter ATP-binding protein [Acholeplasmatales bacterium]
MIFDEIEFDFLNKCTLVIGENGSGKTTLMKILSGLTKSYSGKCNIKDKTSLLLDSNMLYLYKSGIENLNLFLNDDEKLEAHRLIELFEMDDYINKRCISYSNGMRKKLSIVIALSRKKDYLLLDEPTNSLDTKTIKVLIDILVERKKHQKIVISSHDMQIFDKKLIDEVFMIKNKKLYSKKLTEYDFDYYKVKTYKEISEFRYKFEQLDDYYIFKINTNDVLTFSKELSEYLILEMIKIEPYDGLYLKELYR